MLLIFDTHSLNGALFLKVSTLLARLRSITLDYARARLRSIQLRITIINTNLTLTYKF